MDIIGREEEIKTLKRLFESKRPEFLAVYGRRRVGKTYLINNFFNNDFSFDHTGISPKNEEEVTGKTLLQIQLEAFHKSLIKYGCVEAEAPKDWFDAFGRLERVLSSQTVSQRQVVFIDEIPWMDTPKSNFIPAFENFWNSWASKRPSIMLVICGSASAWILDNVINSSGGLYGRVTREMRVSPFTLRETELYLESLHVELSRYDIAQADMIFGGIPFYLNYIDPELSLPQSVDAAFFRKNAPLRLEFRRLFKSAFKNPDRAEAVVRALYSNSAGLSREGILEALQITSGGHISDVLDALVASDFIIRFVPLENTKREELYKLVDPFCLFYLRFVEKSSFLDNSFWSQNSSGQKISSWRGTAFEIVCMNHIAQIKEALGVREIISYQSMLIGPDKGKKAQIDLVIDRNDNIVNLCEMKFSGANYEMTSSLHETLLQREKLAYTRISKKKTIRHVLVTTFGLVKGKHSNVFANVITLDSLFK